MTENPILEDLHKTRERLLAEAGGTIEGLVAQLQRDERQSSREFVRPKDRIKRCTGTADAGVNESDSRSSAAKPTTSH